MNSENDYMQMARIFDMSSLSASIRHFGSSTERGFLEDTIQVEIERAVSERPRPVPPGTAIVTSAGGPTSSLSRNNGVSHIVHVAAVQAILAEHRITPLRGEAQIRDCVMSALQAVRALCAAQGVVSPEGTPQRRAQEEAAVSFAPRRLVLPLFGTGRGGQKPAEVAPLILHAILEFFADPLRKAAALPLTDVHISAYTDDDVLALTHTLTTTAI